MANIVLDENAAGNLRTNWSNDACVMGGVFEGRSIVQCAFVHTVSSYIDYLLFIIINSL